MSTRCSTVRAIVCRPAVRRPAVRPPVVGVAVVVVLLCSLAVAAGGPGGVVPVAAAPPAAGPNDDADAFGAEQPEPTADGAEAAADEAPFGGADQPAATGSITVVLDTTPNSGVDVAFTGCGPLGCGGFALDDDADATLPSTTTFSGLAAGAYTVTQAVAPGWQVDSIVCDTGENVDLGAREAAVDLGDGEATTCTFSLSEDPGASITVVLDAVPDSGTDVTITGCGPFGCGPVVLDDDADPTLASSATFTDLAAGEYTLTHQPVDGWVLHHLFCSTGESTSLVDAEATVDLAEGEHTTCTFVHKPEPTLQVETVATGLSIPWGLDFLPDGTMLVAQRHGVLNVRPPGGTVGTIALQGDDDLLVTGEIGMLGLAVDPDFATNRRITTCQGHLDGGTTEVQVIVWELDAGLTTATRVVDPLVGGIEATNFHGGCRVAHGPDGYLWVTTGDAGIGTTPQDLGSLAGKTLRVDPDTGAGAPDNVYAADGDPGTDARVYTSGHRNVQGLAFRPFLGQAWSVEHGPNKDDEINLLQNGGNYGWDPVPGYDQGVPMTDLTIPGAIPAAWSSGQPTLATSGATFLSGSAWAGYEGWLAVCTLKNSELHLFAFDAAGALVSTRIPAALDGTFGRLRTAEMGPDGALYLTTSNGSNDRVLRVTPT